MNQKNLQYLKDGLKYLGFGEGLNNKLTESVAKQAPQFQIATINEYGKDKVAYTLDFRKAANSDMYFFNKYTAIMRGDANHEKTQTFYINKNAGVTAKEAYNLLEGRSVNKNLVNAKGEKYNAWLQIDFSQKDQHDNYKFNMIHQAYGYNLEKELLKHAIKELNDPQAKEKLIQSLERGNRHQVTFTKGNQEGGMAIEANPRFKTLNIYDGQGKKVFQENERNLQKGQTQHTVTAQKKSEGVELNTAKENLMGKESNRERSKGLKA